MKLNHLFIAALALGLTHSIVSAQESGPGEQPAPPSGGGESNYKRTSTSTAVSKVSTRGAVSAVATSSRTASVSTQARTLNRVNLRRPTATTAGRGISAPTSAPTGGQAGG